MTSRPCVPSPCLGTSSGQCCAARATVAGKALVAAALLCTRGISRPRREAVRHLRRNHRRDARAVSRPMVDRSFRTSDGPVYVDGSCTDTTTMALGRAGRAAVQCDPAVVNAAYGNDPDHITQSVAAAEHGVFLFSIKHFFGSIRVDCLCVCCVAARWASALCKNECPAARCVGDILRSQTASRKNLHGPKMLWRGAQLM